MVDEHRPSDAGALTPGQQQLQAEIDVLGAVAVGHPEAVDALEVRAADQHAGGGDGRRAQLDAKCVIPQPLAVAVVVGLDIPSCQRKRIARCCTMQA